MVYKAMGLMSGASLDGLDIVYVHLHETAGKWSFELVATGRQPYSAAWYERLKNAPGLSAVDYQLLHTDYGRYIGEQVIAFIEAWDLHHKVHLIASHGHTAFHLPAQKMTAQLGDGASIAALTGLPVVSDLRALDMALGGQSTPDSFFAGKFQEVLSALNAGTLLQENGQKEAVIIALIGVLRWREEYNVDHMATGATRNSTGGALWLGGEA